MLRRADFLSVQRAGRRVHTTWFLVSMGKRKTASQGAANEAAPPRLGITVSKKVGKAVVRSRVKRVVREVFRRKKEDFPRGADIVFIAKHNAPSVTFAGLLEEMQGLCRKLSSR